MKKGTSEGYLGKREAQAIYLSEFSLYDIRLIAVCSRNGPFFVMTGYVKILLQMWKKI
ncbi:hypothetical protein HNR77_004517 [Paenibacillus sp. JGP012]|uniref:hypothetical protein n=1 Tax=Paenibacillus sp. JGP012 TaxID=2735914 RepID=UPI00160D3A40|nr:hypothetical protein [Paenibacillus sp. JGP012]MBB6023417.1 hypothetical protein [Paenibacillus sp. JGP012]